MLEFDEAGLVEYLFTLTDGADVFLEVGACEAEFSRRAKAQYPSASVLALEANPYNFAAYRPTMPEGVHYYNAAACETDGPVSFQIMSVIRGAHVGQMAGNNGLRERTDSGIEYETVTVDGYRVDTLLRAYSLDRLPCVMWVDVEGAQDRVIVGARKALLSCQALMIEVEERAYWQGQPLVDDVDAMLAELGLVAVARDFEYPYQHNRVYVPRT